MADEKIGSLVAVVTVDSTGVEDGEVELAVKLGPFPVPDEGKKEEGRPELAADERTGSLVAVVTTELSLV